MSVIRAIAGLGLIAAASCASVVAPLLTPNVNTQAEALRPGAYQLDPAHAALLFKIDHLGFSSFPGRFEKFDVSLDFDSEDPTAARIDAVIDMTSLDIANDDFAATLTGPQWFNASAFPTARFQSSTITVTGDNTGTMTGELTLHGVTNLVTLGVTFNGGGSDRLRGAYIVGFSATGVISRSAFGVDRFSSVIADDVEIEIQAEFERQ